MSTTTTLSVLVPALQRAEYLVYASLERLKILEESPLLERFEVIVVDRGLTLVALVPQEHPLHLRVGFTN